MALLTMVGCVQVAPLATSAPDASASAAASLPGAATPEPERTRRPCQPDDTRPRCQTAAPTANETAPATDSATAAPTDSQAPTAPATEPPTPLPPGISLAPTALDFGLVPVGTTGTIVVVVTNGGPGAATPNYAGGAPLDPAAFGGSQNCAGGTLAELGTCEFTYTFTPPTVGRFTTTTSIAVDNTNFAITFTGCGTTATSIPPDCLAVPER